MEGEEERSDTEGSFSKASIPKRIAIVIAGGTVNILFGVIVYYCLISSTGDFVTNQVDEILPEYAAKSADIQPADEILKVNNKKIREKKDLDEILEKSNGEELSIKLKRNNEILDLNLKPTEKQIKTTGLYFKADENNNYSSEVAYVVRGSVAEKNGIQVKDNIKQVNGINIENDPYKIAEIINDNNEELVFSIERSGENIEIKLTPDIKPKYYLGIKFKQAEKSIQNNLYYAGLETKDYVFSIVDNVKTLFAGKVKANQLMGPVGISGVVAETKGVVNYIYILSLISLSLGVTNLLPFPPLDGGKIVILLIEWIRRKPLKENIEIGIQMGGFALLIMMSVYVTYNDILRIF